MRRRLAVLDQLVTAQPHATLTITIRNRNRAPPNATSSNELKANRDERDERIVRPQARRSFDDVGKGTATIFDFLRQLRRGVHARNGGMLAGVWLSCPGQYEMITLRSYHVDRDTDAMREVRRGMSICDQSRIQQRQLGNPVQVHETDSSLASEPAGCTASTSAHRLEIPLRQA